MNIGEYGLQINNIMHNKPILKESGRKVEACIDLFDVGSSVTCCTVEYNIYRHFIKDFTKVLRNYGIGEMSATNISHYLHEDINRFDFLINFYGFKKGSFDVDAINDLEQIALDEQKLCDLHYKKYLYEFEGEDSKVRELKKHLFNKVMDNDFISRDKKQMLDDFLRKTLKPSIMDINNRLATQFVIIDGKIIPEEDYLTNNQLFNIYLDVKKLFEKYIDNQYFDSYFKAVNKMVLNRYK